jgi:hypothetical protein
MLVSRCVRSREQSRRFRSLPSEQLTPQLLFRKNNTTTTNTTTNNNNNKNNK